MEKNITILLVDDHDLILQGLQHMLNLEDDMEVIGNCSNAEEALSQATKLSPDIVLMDTQLPGMNGIEATRCLKRNGHHCNADIIVLSDSPNHLVEALEAGAAGYFLKDISHGELTNSIRQVCQCEHSSNDDNNTSEETIEIIIPPPTDAIKILQFVNHVEENLHANILQTVGSWDCGTCITILVKPDPNANLLDKLSSMPNVVNAEEEILIDNGFPHFLKRFKNMGKLRTSPKKRILVSLG